MVVNGAGSNYQRINNLPLFSPMSKIEPRLRREEKRSEWPRGEEYESNERRRERKDSRSG